MDEFFRILHLIKSAPRRAISQLLLFLGMLLASPAAWFAWEVFGPDFPSDKTWDFSSSRSIAQLQETKEVGPYYYRGNIRSSINLDGGRHCRGTPIS
jgi:hypothetical protein